MISVIEIRVLGALAIACALVWVGAHFTALHYEALIAKEDAARADMAQAAAERAKDKEDAANTANAKTVAGLTTQLDAIAADRAALASRLQNATAGSRGVSKTTDNPSVAPDAGTQGDGRLIELLTAEISECERNTARYGALIGEVTPQL